MGWFGHPEPQGGGSAPAQRPVARGANGEIERRYGELINSRAFLYAFVDLEGTFLLMNRGMRLFLGPAIPDVLLSCCAPEHRETLQNLLRDARTEAVEAVVPLSGRAGTLWMDAEFSPAGLRGTAAVQIVGMDVTDWVKEQQRLASEARPRAEVREVREEPREAE
ncbi:MAG: hypothetical protein IJ702_01600, partial [Fretibacterium sp.]|nr:hypothetical protein [Fretibacterium sp.]